MVETSNDSVANQSFEGQSSGKPGVVFQIESNSLSWDLRSKLAWIIYFLLPLTLLICGVGHGYQVGLASSTGIVSTFWLFTFGLAALSIAIVVAIWLALFGDVLPHRRFIAFVTLAIVYSVSSFGIGYFVAWVRGGRNQYSPEGDWLSMDLAFYIVSISWWIWCVRIYRGWRITKEAITDHSTEMEPRVPEFKTLLASVLFAMVPFLVYHCMFVRAEHLGHVFSIGVCFTQ